MKCPFVIKVCTKCKRILVANEINFRKKKDGKYGCHSRCKICQKELDKEYRKNNIEEIRRKDKDRYQREKEKRKEYHKTYRNEHKEELKEKNKIYRNEHKEELKEKKKIYYENNKERILNRQKKYYEDNPEIAFNNAQKRRHKLKNQGRGITKEQWLEMMEFFEWKCAYSGLSLDKNNRSIDHIIPLCNNGLNEPWNCIPIFRNYNSKKYTNNMLTWYQQQEFYSEEKLLKIFEWISYAYIKWGEGTI